MTTTTPVKIPTAFRKLMREALDSAEWRGHCMRPWHTEDRGGIVATTVCRNCDCMMTVREKPLPNQTDVAGDAVAIGCMEEDAVHSRELSMGA